MCVSTLPLRQFFHHCISVFPPVSVFPALRQYVCQDVPYHRVSISSTVCLYFHHSVSMCVCVTVCQHLYHCVSISTTVCQYFHQCQYFQHGVSVSSTVSVNTVSVCPCSGVSSQSIMSCSAVKHPSHTHIHTHSGAGGTGPVYADSELAHTTAGHRHCRTQILTAAAKGPRPPPALAHTTATSVRHRQKLLHHVLQASHRPKTSPHSTTMWAGLVGLGLFRGLIGCLLGLGLLRGLVGCLVGLGLLRWLIGLLGWFGLASWVGRLAWLVLACFVGW